jgi:hypothetical protein
MYQTSKEIVGTARLITSQRAEGCNKSEKTASVRTHLGEIVPKLRWWLFHKVQTNRSDSTELEYRTWGQPCSALPLLASRLA